MKAIVSSLALTALTAPAIGVPAVQSTAVDTADLDLESREGQRRLALRIHRAARAICAAEAASTLPQAMRSERRCLRQATSNAMAAADSLRAARQAGIPSARAERVARSD